ncbi:MAG: hypothetical protein Ct9H300mP23_00560 [Nitrospinota bacterium]|nr:MAG: hypothetical protein Ct9H300mP23_00560 [Nitrospinota bacterium]
MRETPEHGSIHLFERGGSKLFSGWKILSEDILEKFRRQGLRINCYFRLETIHQYYKLNFFEYHE